MSDALDLTAFKKWVRTEISSDDATNLAAINAATSHLGTATGRTLTLVTEDTTATARKFRPVHHCTDVLWINDAASITSVVEDGSTLTVDVDYYAEPDGNRNDAGTWRPYDRLYRDGAWWYSDGRRRTITVTAKWGWTSFDPLIGEALKVLAADWLNNRNSSNGIIGATADGFSIGMRENPMVKAAIGALKGPLGIGIA